MLALETGYRHIDTAAAYQNEAQVGQAFRSSGLDRDEVFITTKCFNDDHGFENAKRAFSDSLERLELDFVDLYLIHWPVPSQDRYVETWRALIELRDEGLVRSIGVSNFQPDHLRRIEAETGVTPSVNQIELHPLLQQAGLRREHADRGIVTEAWSPIAQGEVLDHGDARGDRRRARQDAGSGRAALAPPARQRRLPEIGDPQRIEENFEVFDFHLGEDEMAGSRRSTQVSASAPIRTRSSAPSGLRVIRRVRAEPEALCLDRELHGEGQNRTADTTIFSRVLYQLSYLAWCGRKG